MLDDLSLYVGLEEPESPATPEAEEFTVDADTEIDLKPSILYPASSTITPSMSASVAKSQLINRKQPQPSTTNGSDSGSFIRDIAINTALASKSMLRASKNSPISAKLNLATTMPKNMTRFITRLGPLVALQDSIIEIFTWKNPSKTVAILLAYVFLCLFPALCLIMPQAFLVYYIARQYYLKAKNETTGKSNKIHVNLQYLRNMQFIQNHMGIYADGYDEVASLKKLVNWSDEGETMELVKYVILSMFGIVIIARLVPMNYLFLLGGVALFVKNTAIFQVAQATLPPAIARNIQNNVDFVREAISNVARAGKSGGKTCVLIFENQRWWAGLGWISHMLRSERPAFSDETGQIPRPDKESYELPGPDWEWLDSEWKIDMNWHSAMDENAWVFTDHNWSNERNKPITTSLTRRRVWARTMALKHNYKIEET